MTEQAYELYPFEFEEEYSPRKESLEKLKVINLLTRKAFQE